MKNQIDYPVDEEMTGSSFLASAQGFSPEPHVDMDEDNRISYVEGATDGDILADESSDCDVDEHED